MKNIIFFAMLLTGLSLTTETFAQAKTGMVKKSAQVVALEVRHFAVLGNCGMCKKTIEKAAIGAGATEADWNMDTDKIKVTFNPSKTSVDTIQKAIASAGYDNVTYKANDEAYDNLHGCCKYDRTGAAGGTKTCKE